MGDDATEAVMKRGRLGGRTLGGGPHRAQKMAQRIGKEKIVRRPGHLYYVGRDGFVWQVPMRSTRGGKKRKVGTEKVRKEEGFLYFLDASGYVARAKRRNA